MKLRVLTNALLRVASLVFIYAIVFSGSANAQLIDGLNKVPNVVIDTNNHGHLVYLPTGYTASTTTKYPLIIYIMGIGANGDGSVGTPVGMNNIPPPTGLEKLFTGSGAPHEQARAGNWVETYTVNSQSYSFIVVTPQFIDPIDTHIPLPDHITNMINYANANYRVDTSRIYLMGHSQGGGAVWDYAGYSSAYANRVAAITPFSGVSFPTQEKANRMKYAKTAVWAFHNSNDPLVPYTFSLDYVNFYNKPPTPAIPAKLSTFAPTPAGHDSWTAVLSRFIPPGETLNVYQWMLQYARTHTTVFAGEDQTIEPPSNSVQLSGSGTGPNGNTTAINWQKISGPAGGSLSSSTVLNPTASGLITGTYTFRLTLTDNGGASFNDDITVTVTPSFQRIEAESFTTSNGGVVIISTNDGPPGTPQGTKVDGIGRTAGQENDYVDYLINVPATGTYTFRFRAGSGTGGLSLKIKDAMGNVLDTVIIYATGDSYDAYMNLFAYNVNLTAGSQTIRIQNGDIAYTGFRQWFFNYFDIFSNEVAPGPLPVNFTAFNVACNNGAINLVWKTAGEKDTKNFTVEKSSNGSTWSVIATIAADGQTTLEKTYNFKDVNGNTNSLYRIVGNDIDGKKSYTSILRGNCGSKQSFSVYPNPVKEKAVATINLLEKSAVQILLIDNKGATVRKTDSQLPAGTSSVTVDMNGLPTGTYTIIARWGNEVQTVKLIKN